jgi:hypothetical protein
MKTPWLVPPSLLSSHLEVRGSRPNSTTLAGTVLSVMACVKGAEQAETRLAGLSPLADEDEEEGRDEEDGCVPPPPPPPPGSAVEGRPVPAALAMLALNAARGEGALLSLED